MKRVLIDSNFLVALLDQADTWHSTAKDIEHSIPENVLLIVPDIVAAETLSVIARRLEEKKRSGLFPSIVATLRQNLPSSRLAWITPSVPDLYDELLDLMVSYNGTLNFNDCLLVLYMRKTRYQYLLSFDSDFDAVEDIQRLGSRADVASHLT